MNRKQRIENILSNYFKDLNIEVIDNSIEHSGHYEFDGNQETHFCLSIKNSSKITLSRLEIHRKINNLLKQEFSSGLHALEIKLNN